MVGSAVKRKLQNEGYENIIGRTSSELDLRNQQAVKEFFADEKPDVVIDAAARVGGILANNEYPWQFLYENLQIQNNLIASAHENGTGRCIFLGSSCIYPKHAEQPMKEESLLTGQLEPTNQWYAVAKIAGVKMIEALRKQYGHNYVSLMPTNLYGPNDNFDLKTSHVLPAMIRKFHEAKGAGPSGTDAPVTLWGSGTPQREFLYAADLADAIRFVLETPEEELRAVAPDGLLNVGVGEDRSINELAALIQEVVGHAGPVEHDRAKPDGTPRKLVDTTRMERLGWAATTPLREGIERTYRWYRAHENELVAA